MTNHAVGLPVTQTDALVSPVSPVDTQHVSDITAAGVIARAVREMPAVAELSPGRYALAATYGRDQHITGVVVQHPTPTTVTLEVHVVVDQAYCAAALGDAAANRESSAIEGQGILIDVASRIRAVVSQCAQELDLPRPADVDVFIDDIR